MAWLFIIIPVILWILVMTMLITPVACYTSIWDKFTKAKNRPDRANLQIMLDHLRSYPEEWSIGRDSVSFPAKGSKQIYLNYDKDRGQWKYSLAAFDGPPRILDGYFGPQFVAEINRKNGEKESKALLRNFYPELNTDQLLLK